MTRNVRFSRDTGYRTSMEHKMNLRRVVTMASVAWAVHCGGAGAQQISGLGVFGDNIADPGNIPGYLQAANNAGLGPFDANFPPSPPYSANRYSNGRVAA